MKTIVLLQSVHYLSQVCIFNHRKTKGEMTFCSDVMKGNGRGGQMEDFTYLDADD